MRLVMMGTGPFAVPTFCGLLETHHEVVALVTSPAKERQGRPLASPMRAVALDRQVPCFDPDDVNAHESHAQLRSYDADLFVVCDYGQILSAETLATSRLGGINLHASLLPRYRGAAPINWAIYHGEAETGVSVIHMTPRVDAGPVIAQARTPIEPDETAVALEARLAEIGAWLIRRAIDNLEAGELESLPQDPAEASRAPRLKKTDGQIDWNRPAAAIRNLIRAMEPWPKNYTFWRRDDGPPMRLILGPVGVQTLSNAGVPGTVIAAEGDGLIVAAGCDAIVVRQVQPAGKRQMEIAEFLRGYRLKQGDRLGPETPA
jgi:methionyl-tRNA formyltransferase